MFEVVDINDYRAFCFRGEGRCNLVISAKGRRDELRIVWRLAKKRKSGLINHKPKGRLINAYLERIITPLLDNSYLIKARLVYIPFGDLHHLAKIPSLQHNIKVESFDELMDLDKYPSATSRFPARNCPNNGVRFLVAALEMPDATRIPRPLSFAYGPTITLEIKPKQGFFQTHPGIDIPFCNNCILQLEKWKSANFNTMYDFCPLSLYSGDRGRMHCALASLIRDPHRNLRLFVDGNVVHEESMVLGKDQLAQALFPANPNADVNTFISAISCILAGISDDDEKDFQLKKGSVLYDLLDAQRIDTIGIVQAFEYFKMLSQRVQLELHSKSNLLKWKYCGLAFLDKNDPRSLVERYLLAATMKDCSLMISIRLVDKLGISDNMLLAHGGAGYVRVRALDGHSFYFAYSVRIVDLDPKSAKNLENAYNRFMAGVRLIRDNPNIHPPCVV